MLLLCLWGPLESHTLLTHLSGVWVGGGGGGVLIGGHSLSVLYTYGIDSVQFSPLTHGISGGHAGQFCRDPLPVFSVGSHREHFWHRQGCGCGKRPSQSE